MVLGLGKEIGERGRRVRGRGRVGGGDGDVSCEAVVDVGGFEEEVG